MTILERLLGIPSRTLRCAQLLLAAMCITSCANELEEPGNSQSITKGKSRPALKHRTSDPEAVSAPVLVADESVVENDGDELSLLIKIPPQRPFRIAVDEVVDSALRSPHWPQELSFPVCAGCLVRVRLPKRPRLPLKKFLTSSPSWRQGPGIAIEVWPTVAERYFTLSARRVKNGVEVVDSRQPPPYGRLFVSVAEQLDALRRQHLKRRLLVDIPEAPRGRPVGLKVPARSIGLPKGWQIFKGIGGVRQMESYLVVEAHRVPGLANEASFLVGMPVAFSLVGHKADIGLRLTSPVRLTPRKQKVEPALETELGSLLYSAKTGAYATTDWVPVQDPEYSAEAVVAVSENRLPFLQNQVLPEGSAKCTARGWGSFALRSSNDSKCLDTSPIYLVRCMNIGALPQAHILTCREKAGKCEYRCSQTTTIPPRTSRTMLDTKVDRRPSCPYSPYTHLAGRQYRESLILKAALTCLRTDNLTLLWSDN